MSISALFKDLFDVSTSFRVHPRPMIPPIFALGCSLWAVSAVLLPLCAGWEDTVCRGYLCGGAFVSLVSCAALVRKTPVLPCCLLMGAACAAMVTAAFALGMHHDAATLDEAEKPFQVEIIEDAQSGDYGWTAQACVSAGAAKGAKLQLNIGNETIEALEATAVTVGYRFDVAGSLTDPGETSFERAWCEGYTKTMKVTRMEKVFIAGPLQQIRDFRIRAIQAISSSGIGEGAAFLKAVLLGYREGLYDTELYSAVKADGLAHLVAVSGAHLSLVCGLLMTFLRRTPLARPVLYVVQLFLMGAYLVLTGFPVSAIRAAVMTTLALSAFIARRRSYALGAVGVCVLVMVAIDPTAARSVSFGLSAGSVCGIVLFCPLLSNWAVSLTGRRGGTLRDAVLMTLASMIPTAALSTALFGQFSCIAPLANALAAPCFLLLCGVGIPLVIIAGAGVSFVAALMSGLVLCAQVFAQGLEALASLPFACVAAYVDPLVGVTASVLVCVALWLFWPRLSRAAFCGMLVAFPLAFVLFTFAGTGATQVIMLDVGQGDAILLRSGRATMLIDTGTQDTLLLKGLGRYGITHLDAVLITHPDDDHCGSLSALHNIVTVDRVLVADGIETCPDTSCEKLTGVAEDMVGGENLIEVRQGDTLAVGHFVATVVGPDGLKDDGGNADSVVLTVIADVDNDGESDGSALFCGDAEAEQLDAYIRVGRLGKVDLYKVGHHGSRAALDDYCTPVLAPNISLVSVGAHNRYGHPADETIERLEEVGSSIFRTDEQGDIVCDFTSGGIGVRTLR